jgi:hypothetical protein
MLGLGVGYEALGEAQRTDEPAVVVDTVLGVLLVGDEGVDVLAELDCDGVGVARVPTAEVVVWILDMADSAPRPTTGAPSLSANGEPKSAHWLAMAWRQDQRVAAVLVDAVCAV